MAHNSSSVTAVQQGAPRLGYLGTTASSRAKLSQDPPDSSTSTQEEERENLCSSSDLQPSAPLLSAGLDLGAKSEPHQDQKSSVAPAASSQVLATPTEVMSPGDCGRWSVSSVEETPTNPSETLILSPAPSLTPTGTPTDCDIIACSSSRWGDGPGGSETRIQTDPMSNQALGAESSPSDPPISSSSPLSLQSGSGDAEGSISFLQCQQVAEELRQTARRAVHLYQQLSASVDSSERILQMSSVLQEAFDIVNSELQVVLQGGDRCGSSAPSGPLQDDRTMSLLEKYSDQLVQMTQNKLNRI